MGPMGMQWSSCAPISSITHIVFERTMYEASGVYPCSHPPTHLRTHRSIYPSTHPSIRQLPRSHIPPSVHPRTLGRTHAHPPPHPHPHIHPACQPANHPCIKQPTHQSTKPGNNRSKCPVPAWLLQAACNETCPVTRAQP